MDEAAATDYNEPCAQCLLINWGLTDEGRFYCRTCHNVIEWTREVVTGDAISNARAQSISRGLKKKKEIEKGWKWYICEGFQFILRMQAEALLSLGVASQFKDEVLYNLWKLYLQKSKQAYCKKPIEDCASDFSTAASSSPEGSCSSDCASFLTLSSSATEPHPESSVGETPSIGKASGSADWSGSVDGCSYLKGRKKGDMSLSMPMTLAFCYLALLWLREAITLSDLLRLVTDGHVPYLNAYKGFPEEMKLYGADFKIFHVESWPTYEDVHKTMHSLATYLELPRFPDIIDGNFLHPNILCMKYLMEINLPDDMHSWTCRVVRKIGMGEADFLTLQPGNKSVRKVKYDILAVAVIIVVLKILFLLNDQYEWLLSDYAGERNKSSKDCPFFEIRKWYVVIKNAMDGEQKKLDEARVRHLWKCDKPVLYTLQDRYYVLKRRQMVTDLQRQFRALTGSVEPTEKQNPSSFQLNWAGKNAAKNCFHGHRVDGILQEKNSVLKMQSRGYWLCTTKLCNEKECGCLAHYEESDFPHTYRFVLNLFSFLLRVPPSLIHEDVSAVEHKLFHSKLSKKSRGPTFRKVRNLKRSRREQDNEDL